MDTPLEIHLCWRVLFKEMMLIETRGSRSYDTYLRFSKFSRRLWYINIHAACAGPYDYTSLYVPFHLLKHILGSELMF